MHIYDPVDGPDREDGNQPCRICDLRPGDLGFDEHECMNCGRQYADQEGCD